MSQPEQIKRQKHVYQKEGSGDRRKGDMAFSDGKLLG